MGIVCELPRDVEHEIVEQWRAERPDLDLEVMADVARILRAAGMISARIDALAAEYGVDRGQGDVLFALRRAGAPYRLSPSRLSEQLLVTTGTMTNRLDRLEARERAASSSGPDGDR